MEVEDGYINVWENRVFTMINKFRGTWIIGIALIGTFLPILADALDFTSDTTRYLSDPSFLATQGQFFSHTTAGRETVNEDWQPAGGAINTHYSAVSNTYSENISYGITDRLNIAVNAAYLDRNAQETFTLFSPINRDTSQFLNPYLIAVYRAIEQGENPISIDIQASVAPSIVNNEPGTIGASLFINRELRSFTVQGEFGLHHNDAYSNSETLGGTTNRYSDQWGYLIGLRSQFRLTSAWAINAGIIYTESNDYSEISPANYTSGDVSAVSPYVTVAYDLVPKSCNLALEYDHAVISNQNFSGGINGSWINQSSNSYYLHLRVLF